MPRAHLVAAKQAVQAHRRVIDALHRIAALTLDAQPLLVILQEVVQEVNAATGFPIVAIEFYDAVSQCMEVVATTGFPFPDGETGVRVAVDQTLSGLVARSGQVLIEAQTQTRSQDAAAALRQIGVQTFVCLPLVVTDQVIGTLSLAHPGIIPLDDDFLPLAQSLTHIIATLVARRRAEEQTAAAERHLRVTLEERVVQRTAEVQDLYDHAPVGYHSLDPDGHIVRVNQTELDWLGYPREELLGRPITELMTLPGREAFPENFALLKERGWVGGIELELIRKDGSTFPGLINTTALYDATGAFVMSRSTLTDITEHTRAELALRESEARYRTLVEQMTQGVLVYQDEQIIFGNATAAAIIGCSVEELQHAALGDLAGLIHADDLRRVLIPPEERPATGAVTAEPFRFTRVTDGVLRWVLATSTITSYHSRPAVLAVFTDVTALKLTEEQLRLSEARLHLLLDKTPAVIFSSLAEPDFHSTFISESVRAVLGYEPAQFIAHPSFWANRIHPEDKARVFGDAPQLLAQGWRQYEYRCRHADGTYRWIETGVRLLPAVAGHPAEVVGYMIDITLRKQAEALLQHTNAELARASRAKDEFLANMSHELRTPLNVILGYSELLREEIRGPLNPSQQDAMQSIEASGQHLLAMITDILELAKVEAGRLDLQPAPVGIAGMCQASLMFVHEQALKKGLHLDVQLTDPQAEILADPRRLKQMLVNLLSNAVKFTPTGGQITLVVAVDAAAELVRFSVEDTGIGIASDDLGRLFQPFNQVDSALSRQQAGTGLGLALVRRLAELHGGEVGVESTLGVGSRFTITLPVRQPALDALAPALEACGEPLDEPGAVGPTRVRVLLIDDNEDHLLLIGEYLQAQGYDVAMARSGQEALAQVGVVSPAVILMDIQMPELDGLEVIRRLRTMPPFASTPILALTALAMPGDRERCLAAGADDYLTKPVHLRTLIARIEAQRQQRAGPATDPAGNNGPAPER